MTSSRLALAGFLLANFLLPPALCAAGALAGKAAGKAAKKTVKKAAKKPAKKPESRLDRLLRLNAAEMFGAETTVKNGRVTLGFPGKGAFSRAFVTRGNRGLGFFSDEKDVKSAAIRKGLMEGAKGRFSLVGRESGVALSRFELADDLRMTFRLRIRSLDPRAVFNITVNRKDSKNYLQVSSFKELVLVKAGRRRRKPASERKYQAHPSRWFDRKSPGVPLEIVFAKKKLSVVMVIEPPEGEAGKGQKSRRVELASWDGIESPVSGRLALEFRGMSFLVSDLAISGNYDRAWAEAEIAKLEKAGKLKEKEPGAEAPETAAEQTGSNPSTSTASSRSHRRVLGEIDITKPDPEADDEL